MASLRSRQLRAGHLALATVRPTLPRCVSPSRRPAIHRAAYRQCAARPLQRKPLGSSYVQSSAQASPSLPAARPSVEFALSDRGPPDPPPAITNRGPTSARLRLRQASDRRPRRAQRSVRNQPNDRRTQSNTPRWLGPPLLETTGASRTALDHLHAIAIGWAFRDVSTP